MAGTELKFFGAGGHASVVIDAWIASGGHVAAVYDDDATIKSIIDFSVIHNYTSGDLAEGAFCISVGSNQTRKKISGRINAKFRSVIHPTAVVSTLSEIGEGSVIFSTAVVNAHASIGKHVIINTAAVIEHDCEVGDFAHVSPGAVICGGVVVGEGSHVGAGAVVIQNVKIGRWAIVGAGAVITKDVPDYAVVVGAPGRIVRYNTNE